MKIWEEKKEKSFAEMYRSKDSDPNHEEKIRQKIILKEEIPMMLTEEGHVVCIPTNRREELKVGFIGSIRSGKSKSLNRFFNRMFWIGGRKSLWLNDIQNETFVMSRPMQYYLYKKKLALIGEQTLHTPFIHLFPHVKGSTSVVHRESLSAEICFNFKKVLDHPEAFFDFGGSQKYFNNLIEDFRKCESTYDIEQAISKVKDSRVREKIWSTLNYLFEEELFKFNNKLRFVYCEGDFYDKNLNYTKKYSVIPACMLMRGCVALHTDDIVRKGYVKQYTELILRDILELQKNDAYFSSTPTHIAIDEIWHISSKEKVNQIIQEIARVGTLPIGLSYASQSYLQVDPYLSKNTRLTFVFGLKNKDEAKAIANNYGSSNTIVNEMLRLNRDKDECILFTDEKLSVYDIKNNEKYFITNEAIKGIALPPPSNHKTPQQNLITKPLIV